MRDLINEIGQTLSHNKLRTALTGLSVSWGVFMLIVLLSFATGVTNSYFENMMSSSQARIQVWGGMTSRPYHGNREGRFIELKEKDMDVIESEHPHVVKEVSSTVFGSSGNISTNTTSVSSSYTGVFPSFFSTYGSMKLTRGRLFNDRDMNSRAKVMIIPRDYAKQLFPPEGKDVVGKRVNCSGLSFQIVGVYESDWNRDIYIPYSTAMMMSPNKGRLGSITVNLQNVKTEEDGLKAENDIRNTLAATHNFDPTDDSALWINNRFTNSLQGLKIMDILKSGTWLLGILTLLTGIVGISNIMFVSVRERTHEIGIRRAIGAKPRSILTQVIAESVAITVLFGYIGIVLGTATSQVIGHIFQEADFLKDPSVGLTVAFEVTLVLVFSGALAGLFPALRALKVKPVEALRDE